MKTFKILKILFFISIGTFLLSCSNVIRDTDGDGISDTVNLVDDIYKNRETHTMQGAIREYVSSVKKPTWYKPSEDTTDSAPLVVTHLVTPSDNQYIEKNNVKYKPLNKYINNAEIYEIIEGDGTGQFVLITLEPVPIFKENMVILLVSEPYANKANAITDAKTITIPKIKASISHLDLVFNPTMPEDDYVSYENVAENVSAIIAADYKILEFFGTGHSYVEKKELLKKYGYTPLFE